MDIRLICFNSGEQEEIASGEFGRFVKSTKYYHDKKKLALTAKAHLNDLIVKYQLTPKEATNLKICTIQILG